MRKSREESIQRFLKLIDACNECSRSLRSSSLGQPTERIATKLDQFGFELQTELRRLGACEIPAALQVPPGPDCESLLAQYQDTLSHTSSAHARAMLTRQQQEIRDALRELQTRSAA